MFRRRRTKKKESVTQCYIFEKRYFSKKVAEDIIKKIEPGKYEIIEEKDKIIFEFKPRNIFNGIRVRRIDTGIVRVYGI
jgi:hypothetical protein